ncbi:MAG: aldo/keto reductase [Leptospirales bacterium]|nr:aldo/keto reductase [Leptospirales bacterium]
MLSSGPGSASEARGGASAEATTEYFQRIADSNQDYIDRYWHRPAIGWEVSRLGFGSYRVHRGVREHVDALRDALLSGVNVIDTAGNYADGASETMIGQTLEELFRARRLRREMIVLVSKAGFLQGQSARLLLRSGRYSQMDAIGPESWHSLDPDFLEDQLALSLSRLKQPSLDVLLLHNPETAMSGSSGKRRSIEQMRGLLARAFARLEQLVEQGRIGCYGVSSNALSLAADQPLLLSLPMTLELAGPNFRVLQFPGNLLESDFRFSRAGGYLLSDVAEQRGLWTMSNRPLNAMHERHGLVRLARLADPPPDDGDTEIADFDAAIGRLQEIESEIQERFGGERFRFGPELPAPSQIIQELRPRLLHREALRANLHLLQSPLQRAANRLNALAETEGERYAVEALARTANAALAHWERELDARYHQRMSSVEDALRQSSPRLAGLPLALQALLYLLARPTPVTVLAGMRRKEYVRQLCAAFRNEPPAPEEALAILQKAGSAIEEALH